ncbi:MAG: hypothetical protein BMS9Abin34_379 [Patescibacteria group bacterium]|nr:MAG: hypothetical protein BMS9Abin34_379 [Patescibacteria group bacterium]
MTLLGLWKITWIRRSILVALFGASALSYPILFRALGQTYGFMDRWEFGLVLAALILLHEWFHLRAMDEHGIEGIGPIPIPFLGALVETREPFPTLWKKFSVVLRGPLSGMISIPILLIGVRIQSGWLIGSALLWLAINALNLLPIFPLDGGLAVAAVLGSFSRTLTNLFVVVSLVVSVAIGYLWNPLFYLIPAVTALEMVITKMRRKEIVSPEKMSGRQAILAVVSYLGAGGAIGLSIFIFLNWPLVARALGW